MSTKVWMQWEYELPEAERPQWEELFEKAVDTVLRSEGVFRRRLSSMWSEMKRFMN